MRCTLKSLNPEAKPYDQHRWTVGQQWQVELDGDGSTALLPSDYYHTDENGRRYVRHVLIVLEGVEELAVVADITATMRHGSTLSVDRSPRQDADLAAYICQLHNEFLD